MVNTDGDNGAEAQVAPKKKRRWPWVVLILIIGLASVAGVYLINREEPPLTVEEKLALTAVKTLYDALKVPSSFELHSVDFVKENYDDYIYLVRIGYSAANSYNAKLRDTAYYGSYGYLMFRIDDESSESGRTGYDSIESRWHFTDSYRSEDVVHVDVERMLLHLNDES
jgi:hypothetical protein